MSSTKILKAGSAALLMLVLVGVGNVWDCGLSKAPQLGGGNEEGGFGTTPRGPNQLKVFPGTIEKNGICTCYFSPGEGINIKDPNTKARWDVHGAKIVDGGGEHDDTVTDECPGGWTTNIDGDLVQIKGSERAEAVVKCDSKGAHVIFGSDGRKAK